VLLELVLLELVLDDDEWLVEPLLEEE